MTPERVRDNIMEPSFVQAWSSVKFPVGYNPTRSRAVAYNPITNPVDVSVTNPRVMGEVHRAPLSLSSSRIN